MLESGMLEQQKGEIRVEDAEPSILKEFLRFLRKDRRGLH